MKDGVLLRATFEAFNVLDDETRTSGDILDGGLVSERRFGRQFQLGLRVGF